jgi:hypothetical protein
MASRKKLQIAALKMTRTWNRENTDHQTGTRILIAA